jgi:hypothetical protein
MSSASNPPDASMTEDQVNIFPPATLGTGHPSKQSSVFIFYDEPQHLTSLTQFVFQFTFERDF